MHFISQELEIISSNTLKRTSFIKKPTRKFCCCWHFQGRVLIAKLIRQMNILEIGTYTGYSACLCEGMQENGILHTIDIKEELVDFKESILTNRLGSADHTTPR
jgi:hypothetical protein